MKKAAINLIGEDRCTGCLGCYDSCEKNAIRIVLNKEGFIIPEVDKEKCVECGICQNHCPVINKPKQTDFNLPRVFGSWTNDDEIRLKSSSGGVFTAIADFIIKQGGVVFGAAFNESFNAVEHIGVQDAAGLKKLRGSKYIQSNTSGAYKKAVELAKNGRKVLFSGTPCQIASLRTFLKDDEIAEKIITCEVVCHGVPSQSVFQNYLNCLEQKYKSKTASYNFRDKRLGWDNYKYGIEIVFSNKKRYFKSNKKEPFMRGYLKNIFLRKSCYNCEFSSLPRAADITLGDFWGIGESGCKSVGKQDLKKGVSAVLLNTEKGLDLFRMVNNLTKFEASIACLKKYNPRIDGCRYSMDNKRDNFFELLNLHNFNFAAKKILINPDKLKRLIYICKIFIRRIFPFYKA